MRHRRIWAAGAAGAAVTLALTTATAVGSAQASAQASPAEASPAASSAVSTTPTVTTSYVVLLRPGASVERALRGLRATGATVTDVNRDIGLVTVTTRTADFRARGAAVTGVQGVADDVSIGSVPRETPQARIRLKPSIERPVPAAGQARTSARRTTPAQRGVRGADPLDRRLWGMRMLRVSKAHRVERASKRVRVGVIDTGIQGSHPDLAANFDRRLSRNFTTDIPALDGPCEHAGCKDPVGEDDNGHGTHVAGTMAASLDHFGLSGVAPRADLVELRAGQDSGYFFLAPTVNALTYAGRHGIDVVNMSFYVDPWLYNCSGGAPEDSPAEAADQAVIITAMDRALDFAHAHRVTMVSALGNEESDLAAPPVDESSPDYGADPHTRTIDPATCVSLPTEGPHVLGVSSVGPSRRKSDFSNYTTRPGSGELEVSAPGGWYRDGLGTPGFMTNENLILSTYSRTAARDEGLITPAGQVTPLGTEEGLLKRCRTRPGPGARCGYYAWLQGTSMASPHAAGVAALIVAADGHRLRGGGFGMSPDRVARILMRSATDHRCPPGGVQRYLDVGRDDTYSARCVGTTARNGLYGAGIVNAWRAVTFRR